MFNFAVVSGLQRCPQAMAIMRLKQDWTPPLKNLKLGRVRFEKISDEKHNLLDVPRPISTVSLIIMFFIVSKDYRKTQQLSSVFLISFL